MNPTPPSVPIRGVIISGINVCLTESIKHSLLVKITVNGDSRSVLLERKEKPVGDHLFTEPMKLREGSILSVQVQEKHRVRADQILAQLNLSFDKLCSVQGLGRSEANYDKYLVDLPDPKQQIWLNFSMIPSSSLSKTSQAVPRENIPQNQKVAEALENTTKSLQDFKTAFDRLGGAKLEKGMKLVEAFGELHPTAKVVIKLVKTVHDEVKTHDLHHKELLDLAESMEKTLELIPVAEEVAKLTVLKDTIWSFYELMGQTVDFVSKWLQNDGIAKVVNVFESQTEIESLKKRYKVLETALDRGVAIDSATKIDHAVKLQELEELKGFLGVIAEAQPRADPCMEGTRANILSNVESKIYDLEGKNIIWVYGAPGSGKSAVSLTIKSRLHKQGRLATYFRFDRNDATVTTSRGLWCLVGYELSKRYPSVLKHNLSLSRENKVNLTSTTDLFKSIVEEPLSRLADAHRDHPIVIVIDALDECGGFEGRSSSDRKALLQTLAAWSKLPNHVKLLVTSREERDITRVLSSISATVPITSGKFLTDNPGAQTSIEAAEDIHKYLESHFVQIRETLSSLPPEWPGKDIIADMVHRAAGNFMWATTAVNFIDSGLSPQDQLESIMGDAPESLSMEPLYSLYFTILETSFGKFTSIASDAEVLRGVLGTIVLAQQPLRDDDYTKLPTSKPVAKTTVELIRDRLHSVLDQGPTLRFVHKSFDDFLLSQECPHKYRIRIDESQHLLTQLCLTTMTTELRFNICGLGTSCLKNVDVPDIETKVRDGISSLLSYSCRFWADHLGRTSVDEQLIGAVKEMIFEKLLYWLEAMSLLTAINQVSHSLIAVLNWAKSASDAELDDFLRDAHRFIGAFGQPISQSAAHVYISALPFAPKHSPVSRHFLSKFPQILEVSVGKAADWSPCVFTSDHHEFGVSTVAFSPDNKYFVSGSGDGTICVCDSETGNLISAPFTDSGVVMCCLFDSENRQVWTRCWDGKIIGWDIETGDKRVEFQAGEGRGNVMGYCCPSGGNTIVSVTRHGTVTLWNADTGEQQGVVLKVPNDDEYSNVSFSPDGCYMAWAGQDDRNIRIWKLEDGIEIIGEPEPSPRVSHPESICALSYSVDGHFIVSGSSDGTMLISDGKTGDVVDRPLVTGMGWVYTVLYSHETKVIVASLERRLMVWNASTHEAVLSHLEGVYSMTIALSYDGQRVLSVGDKTVRMWDLRQKVTMPVMEPSEGHTDRVNCVVFSPCGKMVASLGDDTIRFWDVNTGERLLKPINILSPYFKLNFFPDGSHIVAFDSFDGIIRAWNVNSGALAFEGDMKDDNRIGGTWVRHVALRSTDQRLVTCSSNGAVRIWRLEDGSLIEDGATSSPQPVDPSNPVKIIALLPDGLTAIVLDLDRAPPRYLWSTTTHQPLPLTFADDDDISIYSAACSLSGTFFASVSANATLRVWNIQTGEVVASLSTLGISLMDLVVSPDGRYITSPYLSTNTAGIRSWNTQTGRLALEHRKAHAELVHSLAFSPDGKTLASGSEGGQIGIWNAADFLGHTQGSDGFLGVGTHMHDGWVTDADGQLLFWVPKDHRSALVWPENIGIVTGGQGMRTEIDLTRFKYGLEWEQCFASVVDS